MEIVHVVRQYKPSVGGLEEAVHKLCLHLSRMDDVKVRVVTLNRLFSDLTVTLPAHEVIDGIEVTRIPFSGSKRYPIAPQVLNAIKGADIIHVHAVDFFFDFLSLFRWLHKKPMIASTHGGFFHTNFAARMKRWYFTTITRFTAKGYKIICASSENDAHTFQRIADNVLMIENGVDIEKWHDAGNAVPSRRMIYIGRWSVNKRVPLLILLTAYLQKLNPDWRLIIAGIPADDTEESLRSLCEELSVTHAVQIVSKPSEAEIKKLIGTASYIATASSYEGFGISVIEGLSAGLFPIVTPLPPFMRLLNALGDGLIIDADNLEKTAEDIEKSLKKPSRVNRNDCIDLSHKYAWGGVTRQFMNIYNEVLCNEK